MTGFLIAVVVLVCVLGYTVALLARRIAQVEQSVKDVHPLNRVAFYEAHGPNHDPIETAVSNMWGRHEA